MFEGLERFFIDTGQHKTCPVGHPLGIAIGCQPPGMKGTIWDMDIEVYVLWKP